MPQPNYVVGMAHGVLFVMYVVLLAQVGFSLKWSFWKMFLAFIAAFIPFGTFWADVKLFRSSEIA